MSNETYSLLYLLASRQYIAAIPAIRAGFCIRGNYEGALSFLGPLDVGAKLFIPTGHAFAGRNAPS